MTDEKIPQDFMEIGGSPVPGLTLRHVLRGHTGRINRIAWSPDGRRLASASRDKTIRIWDVERGECTTMLREHEDWCTSVAWSPDGGRLARDSYGNTVCIWDAATGETLAMLRGHTEAVTCVTWSPDGRRLASGSFDNTIRIWNTKTGETLAVLQGHTNEILSLAWSPDGSRLASGDINGHLRIWIPETAALEWKLEGHSNGILGLVWTPNRPLLVSGSADRTIRIWDMRSDKSTQVLEGHTDFISSLSVSYNNTLLASKATDGIRLWRTDTWETVAVLEETQVEFLYPSLAFHPRLPRLATHGENGTIIRIWDLDYQVLLGSRPTAESVRYTTAKLVLVGDSGVGKTGLGWRLAHGEFKEHASTHGQQFWPVDRLCTTRRDGTQCEAVLWDLAGQQVFRPVHTIFLDDVDLSLVLFDPSNRQEPLKGVQFWLEQLAGKHKLPPTVLVGARIDVSPPALSQQELDQFCQRYAISGGYISTSAKTGAGLDQLVEVVKALIPWEQKTTTVTTLTFKRIKEHVLALKEKPDRRGVLVRAAELRAQLQAADPAWQFSDAEMLTAVKHLETHGYVAILRSSSGEVFILLAPELLVDLASSIFLQAGRHPRDLGALSETELLQGRYPFSELKDLAPAEQRVLLDAAVARFLDHAICFRESLGSETLLIFPGLIKQKRPLLDEVESEDDVSYVVHGRVENVYAALVVLLGYTQTFTRVNQWQNQAQYELGEGQICGFRLVEEREGEIELVLYYSPAMPDFGRKMFQGLFEQFLYQHEVEVMRFPPIFCPNEHRQERATVVKRVREGKTFLFCDECGERVALPEIAKPGPVGGKDAAWIRREEALARLRSAYETHLVNIKSFRRDRAAPRCYISALPEETPWAEQLAHDLRDAGVYVIPDRDQVAAGDFVVAVDTPPYQRSFERPAGPIAADVAFIRARLAQGKRSGVIILSRIGDFQTTSYAVSLFDLALTLYAIPLGHPAFAPLRKALHRQWEETLSGMEEEAQEPRPLKLFISYSHKDEEFKDKLVTMLAGLQRRGVVDVWQDRRIEAGDEWYQAIQDAMNECDMALLLVSDDFIASRFIQEEELTRLLQRRQEEGLRVVPIIVRPCPWQSEPVLKDLQALPKDGKPVITFSKGTGARDRVWTAIAQAIEARAKKMAEELAHPESHP
jgi:small GTP-binding protein